MIHSDTSVTVRSIESRRARKKYMLDLLQKLHFIMVNNIRVVIDLIATKDNRLADEISREKSENF